MLKTITSELKTEFNRAIQTNAALLKVPAPRLAFVPASQFTTPSTRAALSDDGKLISVNRDMKAAKLDAWFAISHEMRHLWQMKHGKLRSTYAPSSTLPLAEYNDQDEEIDAHAWAVIMMANTFGIRPTLENNLGKEVWNRIERRAEEIANELKTK